MKLIHTRFPIALGLAALLSACGGGGSSTGLGSDHSLPPAQGLAPPCPSGCDYNLVGEIYHQPPSAVALPKAGDRYSESPFGTQVQRVHAPAGSMRIRHNYSKADVFNRDSSMAILQDEQGRSWLYDTFSWQPLKRLSIASSQAEIQWHPLERTRLYFLDFAEGSSSHLRRLREYDVESDQIDTLFDFSDYQSVSSRGEGNMDRNRHYLALIGVLGSGRREALVFHLPSRQIIATHALSSDFYDWISMSPDGQYVVLMGGNFSRIYDRELNQLHRLPMGSFGHGDLCLGFDQRPIMVFDGADLGQGQRRDIAMADLTSGEISRVGQIGWGATPHVSCRNMDNPGWALISTQTTQPAFDQYTELNDEVFWLRLDGSGEVRRVAPHRSLNNGYFSEPHATSDRQGRWVLFASNWQGQSNISSYAVSLSALRQ